MGLVYLQSHLRLMKTRDIGDVEYLGDGGDPAYPRRIWMCTIKSRIFILSLFCYWLSSYSFSY